MNYKIDYDNNSLILYPTGRIDVISARELDKEMEEISADFGNFDVLINFENSGLISSTGFAVILNFQRRRREENRKVFLSNFSKENLRIIDLTGIYNLFQIFNDESDFFKSKDTVC
ncbi:MAG: STAS domain-containing protein [Leptospiraceae bacterium]|nr:STAS domain-containing protein [Leptospiraceae bacterium]